MGRLFWKIFLTFWLTLLLIVSGVIWGTTLYLQNSDAFRIRDLHSRFVKRHVVSLRQVIRVAGADAVIPLIKAKPQRASRPQFFVVDQHGKELLGRRVNPDDRTVREHQSVTSPQGEMYRIFTLHQVRPVPSVTKMFLRPFKRSPGIYAMWFGIALVFSGLVCFWLAWYITLPIRSLQSATKQLAAGNLDTRVAKKMGNRRDEIADLGHDFDHMAGRLQTLLMHQKQLLSDVSHELRSPLARLKVALGLAQKRSPNNLQDEFQRIEKESNRLDDLIGQVLTLSRLDAGAVYRKEDYLDLAQFLGSIIKDCNYEAKGEENDCDKKVVLAMNDSGIVEANADLLRRALENVIRNAFRYTADNTRVLVTLNALRDEQPEQTAKPPVLILTVCDSGPGVPEKDIGQLFEPFIRLSSARDRKSGGYGLGLAIAKRAIEFHGGQIRAWNQDEAGMCVEIILPEQTLDS